MIFLVTGAPGMGKTATALAMLLSMPQYPDKVMVVGVREYKGKGQYLETLPEDFDFSKYPGFVFLIDEAQDYWPSRVAGYKAPASLDFLPKHRHIGQDFILTCQFPTQLDVKLRQIIGRHVHLKAEALGVFRYESGQCEDKLDFDPNSKRPRGAISGEVKAIYNSMEGEETKLQKSRPKLPIKLWLVLGVVVVMFSVVGYFLFGQDTLVSQALGISDAEKVESAAETVKEDGRSWSNPMPRSGGGKSEAAVVQSVKNLREIRHPLELAAKNTDYPELAPQPRLPVSCVANAVRCVCYDQAAQLIEKMSDKRCRALVSGQDALVSAWARDDTPRRQLYEVPPPRMIAESKEADEGAKGIDLSLVPDRSKTQPHPG